MNIRPLRDKIIVKPEQRFKSELLDLSKVEGAQTVGHVIALGDEAERMGLKMGDRVHFGTVADTVKDEYLNFEPIQLGEDKCLKMSWQDICFVEECQSKRTFTHWHWLTGQPRSNWRFTKRTATVTMPVCIRESFTHLRNGSGIQTKTLMCLGILGHPMRAKIQWLLWKIGKMLEKKDPKKRPRLYKQATVVTGEDK